MRESTMRCSWRSLKYPAPIRPPIRISASHSPLRAFEALVMLYRRDSTYASLIRTTGLRCLPWNRAMTRGEAFFRANSPAKFGDATAARCCRSKSSGLRKMPPTGGSPASARRSSTRCKMSADEIETFSNSVQVIKAAEWNLVEIRL